MFFCFNLVAVLCYLLFFPETKGRTLEQLDELFGDQLVEHMLGKAGTEKTEEEKRPKEELTPISGR